MFFFKVLYKLLVVKKIRLLLLVVSSVLVGCSSSTNKKAAFASDGQYGIFLGCDSSSTNEIKNYSNIAIDLQNFSQDDISTLKENNCFIYAYLSVGSLEKYRSYYPTLNHLTFMDYENWPDERWVNVSDSSWQGHILTEAKRFKELGADGIFMDNFDVYYIASEVYKGEDIDKEDIYQGCLKMLNDLSSTGLKLMINSGTDFLERMKDENRPELKMISVYAQETVFSKIDDYEKNIFSKQGKEEQDYLLSIVEFMRYQGDVLFIEYTKDESLKKEISEFCDSYNYHYFISDNVDLKI